ncbi:hypothetical protein SAMN04488102_1076 [Alkalibacterium subtropicum]|uniref:Uncharacterized protein n=1 Tax=Alkalibacterium subtropicum TaxID=753702 RepID=A0A1I1JBY3_9LACT|nr:hypothetical protein [Alkalibacterium subtropicum]SFC44098.1 hypothetical protein SAMN04488102_1076 [Alkalibacterium subtropicum]
MDLLLWVTISFIVIGFSVLFFMKKGMDIKLAHIQKKSEYEEKTKKEKAIVWWIRGVIVWGIISMLLIILNFYYNFG